MEARWEQLLAAPSNVQPEDFWITIKHWIFKPLYKEIHKIEILTARLSKRDQLPAQAHENAETYQIQLSIEDLESLDFSILDQEAHATAGNKIVFLEIRRRFHPTDYTRKPTMEAFVRLDFNARKVDFVPIFPGDGRPDPEWLPKYHVQAELFSIQLLPPSSEGTNTKGKKNQYPTVKCRDEAEPSSQLVFGAVLFKEQEHRNEEKIRRVGVNTLKTLEKWARRHREGGYEKHAIHDSIVSKDDFTATYRRLKEKYGYWVQLWDEATDPQKFVFEDIGIAAFLITLWETFDCRESDSKRPKFVDLGAGNGFLVYLLVSEGYEGYGIDIQRRKIWSKFPTQVRLLEQPIFPETLELEDGVNWILANHSDELTPWIPLIARRTNAKFWLLPCCEWDFDRPFIHNSTKKSRYHSYLEYVRKIIVTMGYTVEMEHMRIPSTRNVCFIGRKCTTEDATFLDQQKKKLLDSAGFVRFEPRAQGHTAPPTQAEPVSEIPEVPYDRLFD